jgi:uncharacterized paraquat-inducible protein A
MTEEEKPKPKNMRCPACQQIFQVDLADRGKVIPCPFCEKQFRIPTKTVPKSSGGCCCGG